MPSSCSHIENRKIKVCNRLELGVRKHLLASKSLITDLASKRLFLRMDMHMSFQVLHTRERPPTKVALDFSATNYGR